MKKIIAICFFSVIFILPSHAFAASARLEYVKQQLIKQGYSRTAVNKLFLDRRLKLLPQKTVAYKQPNWNIITAKLTSDALIQEGRTYIFSYDKIFAQAEQNYGVPKEVLAGIIAIETDFGKNSGSTVVFNALQSRMRLATWTRWKSQAAQLIALSKYCLDSKIDCYSIKGSYAGAFGIVQFMPDSLLAYGVDGDGNGVIDLANPVDAIPSAANYLKQHGYADNPIVALTRYYGSSVGYPGIVMKFAELVKQ